MTEEERVGWGEEQGALLKQLRLAARKTQSDLATALGVSQPTNYNWERGYPGDPTDRIPEIESALGVSFRYQSGPGAENETTTDLALWLQNKVDEKRSSGTTIQVMAAEIGVSVPTLYNVMKGTVPQPRTLEKLTRYFGALPDEVSAEAQAARSVLGLGEYFEFDPYDESQWPADSGVYILYDISDRPIYVGKSSKSVAGRLRDHKTRFWFKWPLVAKAAYVKVEDGTLIDAVEMLLIKVLRSQAVVNQQGVIRDIQL
ncbi:MAG: helix-turn-helix domain-containing protein [Polyangiaceae bacterium]